MDKEIIREQFGANAAAYVDSKVHAKGASLPRLVELLQPQPDWHVLDIATGTGHTAFAVAPHVAHVWATDLTPAMLDKARTLAAERAIENVTIEIADAESLPYGDNLFDLVTCRIAPHHFGAVGPFLTAAGRVLKPNGRLAIVDNIVPAGPPGAFVNAFEKLRDPSHARCLTLDEWVDALQTAGFTLAHQELMRKAISFAFWAGRHDAVMQTYLRAMLSEVAGETAVFLDPVFSEDDITFHLSEGIIISQKALAT